MDNLDPRGKHDWIRAIGAGVITWFLSMLLLGVTLRLFQPELEDMTPIPMYVYGIVLVWMVPISLGVWQIVRHWPRK